MKNRIFAHLMILGFLPLFSLLQCQKKSNVEKGVVTFVKGNVEIIRENGNIRQAKTKDAIIKGDDIRTGTDSFILIQFARLGVVRIDANTLLNISQLLINNVTELYLLNGKIISKIVRTDPKKDKFFIKTPTVVAGLRGTVFSVEYREGEEVISVKKGKIALTTKNEFKETLVTEGKTAVVTEKTQLRDSTKVEKLEMEKVAMVKVVENFQNISNEGLNDLQSKILETEKTVETEIRQEEKKTPPVIKPPKKYQTLKEIQKTYKRIDEISLYNGKIIKGAIISRGDVYQVVTDKGKIMILKKEIKNIKVIR
jgi:hypothetical protein